MNIPIAASQILRGMTNPPYSRGYGTSANPRNRVVPASNAPEPCSYRRQLNILAATLEARNRRRADAGEPGKPLLRQLLLFAPLLRLFDNSGPVDPKHLARTRSYPNLPDYRGELSRGRSSFQLVALGDADGDAARDPRIEELAMQFRGGLRLPPRELATEDSHDLPCRATMALAGSWDPWRPTRSMVIARETRRR